MHINITCESTWKKEKAFWWQPLITAEEGFWTLHEKEQRPVPSAAACVKGAVVRRRRKEVEVTDGVGTAWRERDRDNSGCKKGSLQDQWLHLNSDSKYLLMVYVLSRCVSVFAVSCYMAPPDLDRVQDTLMSLDMKCNPGLRDMPSALSDKESGPSMLRCLTNCGARNILNILIPLGLGCWGDYIYFELLEYYNFWQNMKSLNLIHSRLNVHCVAFYIMKSSKLRLCCRHVTRMSQYLWSSKSTLSFWNKVRLESSFL